MRNGLNKACILKDSETLLRLLHVIFHIFILYLMKLSGIYFQFLEHDLEFRLYILYTLCKENITFIFTSSKNEI